MKKRIEIQQAENGVIIRITDSNENHLKVYVFMSWMDAVQFLDKLEIKIDNN